MAFIRDFIECSNKIEGVDSEQAIEDSLSAWEYLTHQTELTHHVIKEIHRQIMENRQPSIAGEYRDIHVHINGEQPPSPTVVHEKMDSLLNTQLNTPLEAIEWHIQFEKIQPFADGNGRTGRLLYAWHASEQLNVQPIIWGKTTQPPQAYYDLISNEPLKY